MVTDTYISDTSGNHHAHTLFGLSKDEKPVNVPNGSLFAEMDTSNLYVFDAEGQVWIQWGA